MEANLSQNTFYQDILIHKQYLLYNKYEKKNFFVLRYHEYIKMQRSCICVFWEPDRNIKNTVF